VDGLVVPIYTVTSAAGAAMSYATLDGRGPRGRGEIVLGPDTAHRLDVGIGDHVTLGDGHRFRVVGLGLLPTTPHSSFDQGAWIGPEDLPRAIPRSVRETLSKAYGVDLTDDAVLLEASRELGNVAVRLRPGADLDAVMHHLQQGVSPEIFLSTPTPSADQQAMHNVRSLPILFGVFAPLVALAALLHVSSSVLRRRGTDVAVLRAIGLTPRQAGACVAWQSTILAVIGLVVGAPLGFIAGRSAWRVVAEHTPIVLVIPSLSAALLLVVPAALLAANVAGARPAWRVARSSPVEQLRAD
jgi:predicted lysophospholipase L1 biosynthesis ABC-type transport system permease subunit